LGCFEREFTMGRSVEITLDDCGDCTTAMTFLATGRRDGFMITHETSQLLGLQLTEISVASCEKVTIELTQTIPGPLAPDERYPFIACQGPVDLYRCQQPSDAPSLDEPEPGVPVTPLKLGDVSAAGNIASEILHLYVSNQSFTDPLVSIDIYIDDRHVISGDFDVGSQHSWFEFEILVPVGSHSLKASSRSQDLELQQTIDVPAERWAVVDYWNDGGEEIEKFAVSVHDQPVSFE
jgi:hypothetical protein